MSVSPSPYAAGQPPFAVPPPAKRSRGTIVTGIVLMFVGIVVPIVFVVAQFEKLETADSLGVPLGRGTASIDMTAGHAYDVLTERRGRLNTCVLDGPEGTETVSVRARSSRIEYSVGDRQDPGDDVARGVWYVAGSFESPMSGDVTVVCEGDAAAGALTLIPDDDVYGGLGFLFLGGGLLFILGLTLFIVGLVRKRPVTPVGSFGGYTQPGYPGAGVPPGTPVGAGAGAPAGAGSFGAQVPQGPQPLAPPLAPVPAPWEVSYQPPAQTAPLQEPTQPSQPYQSWQPQPWQPQQPAQRPSWQPAQPAPEQASEQASEQSSGWKPREWQPRDWSVPGGGADDGADDQDGGKASKEQ